MSRTEQIEEYLTQVCGQIRWEKAHPAIRKELQQHLLDQAKAFEEDGVEAEQATAEAIREMGDPVLVGTQLDRSYRPKFSWPILMTAFLLMVVGMITRWMMSIDLGILFSFTDCVSTMVMSAVILLIVMKVDYTIFSRTWLMYIGYLIGILAAFLMSNTYGIVMLLPPYFLITAAPIVCCSLVYKFRDGGFGSVWLCYMLLLLPMLLVSGRMSVLFLSSFAVLLTLMTAVLTGAFPHLRQKGATAASLLCLVPISIGLLLLTMPYQTQRLAAMLIPESDPQGYGYIVMMVRGALAEVKWVGPVKNFSKERISMGLGYILTWMVCRFGWISLIGVAMFALILLLLVVRSYRGQKGLLARLMLCGVACSWIVQILSSLVVNLGLTSAFSFPFPFFGGNMAIIFNTVLLGILLSVCQVGVLGAPAEKRKTEPVEALWSYHYGNNRIRLDISHEGIHLDYIAKKDR